MPEHVAIVMDGNGRWARSQGLPRADGHRAGISALRETVRHGAQRGIRILTTFVFSSENWRRPRQEIASLLELIMEGINDETDELFKNNVKISFIGDVSAFPKKLRTSILNAERRTRKNNGLRLVIAVNYGGRQELVSACKKLFARMREQGRDGAAVSEDAIRECLELQDYPDLFIRTGGEVRLSNFLLWQLAYTEMYFTDVHWPNFDAAEFDRALQWYIGRQRRFGRISEQVDDPGGAAANMGGEAPGAPAS